MTLFDTTTPPDTDRGEITVSKADLERLTTFSEAQLQSFTQLLMAWMNAVHAEEYRRTYAQMMTVYQPDAEQAGTYIFPHVLATLDRIQTEAEARHRDIEAEANAHARAVLGEVPDEDVAVTRELPTTVAGAGEGEGADG